MIERSAVLAQICKQIPEIDSKFEEQELTVNIKEDTNFTDAWLGFDSMDRLELIMALEEEFEIEIEDLVVDRIFTVSDMIDAVVEAAR